MRTTRRKLLLEAGRCAAALAASQIGALKALFPQQPAGLTHTHVMPGMAASSAPAAAIPVHRPLRVDRIEPFVDPLPIPPVAKPTGVRPYNAAGAAGAGSPRTGLRPGGEDPSHLGTGESKDQILPFYRFTMRQVPTKIHRDVPPTPMWSYGETVPGPTIEARTNHPILVEWVNALPTAHFLPIDHTLHGAAADQPQVRTAVHVHGAKVPPQYDGFPEDWQTPGQSTHAVYPLNQDAATLWYHDHAMGIERLNQYAGLFGFFLLRDEAEDKLGLPSGKYEIPLAFADRLFAEDGSLYYPDSGDPAAPWIPELYGDAMLVNGKLTPFLEVEPRPYRFRVLNAANSRTWIFSLSNHQSFHQIGSDQGLLSAPVELNQLQLSPGERGDIIIDFSAASGQRLTLNNQSWELMQFRVASSPSSVASPQSLVPSPSGFSPSVPGPLVPASPVPVLSFLRSINPIPESDSVKTRLMILREYMDVAPKRMLMLLNATRWHEPITERPELDSVEIWSFANTTGDIHPIHLHLVRFQVLDRQSFDADEYLLSGKLNYRGAPALPPPGERGWKDTVQTYPETVTRIIVRFEGYTGRYVWHCHLLEHAANEMMRPFEVMPRA